MRVNKLLSVHSTNESFIQYQYDSDSFVTKKTNHLGEVTYTYDWIDPNYQGSTTGRNQNKIIASESFDAGITVEYNYLDKGLGLLSQVSRKTQYGTVLNEYYYKEFNKDGHSYLTSRIDAIFITTEDQPWESIAIFYDDYDLRGNITKMETIFDMFPNSYFEQFTYDDYNQLVYHYVKDTNLQVTKTYYTYDGRGNITSIQKYTNDILTSSSTFTYQSTGWTDQMIFATINGVTYSMNQYDSIGNPLTYFGWNVTYEQRSITSLSKIY